MGCLVSIGFSKSMPVSSTVSARNNDPVAEARFGNACRVIAPGARRLARVAVGASADATSGRKQHSRQPYTKIEERDLQEFSNEAFQGELLSIATAHEIGLKVSRFWGQSPILLNRDLEFSVCVSDKALAVGSSRLGYRRLAPCRSLK